MRVVIGTTATEPGGVWRHCRDLGEGLVRDGHRVSVAVPDEALDRARSAMPGLAIRTLSQGRERVDVWHLHLGKTFDLRALVVLTRLRLLRAARRVVVTEHLPRHASSDPTLRWDPQLPPGIRKPGAYQAKTLLKRLQFRMADSTIAVSGASRDFMARRYRWSRQRIAVVPNGIELPAAPAMPPPPRVGGAMRVVCIGSVSWRKGYDVLLAAVGAAVEDWTVEVHGDGDRLDEMRRVAEATAGRVRFLGWRPDASAALVEADVMCLPSRSEAMPYVVLEAMAAGRAVVASAVDGVVELVDHDASGLLVPSEDPAALAAALDRLARDPAARRRMGEAGRVRVRDLFSERQMVNMTVAEYRRAGAR